MGQPLLVRRQVLRLDGDQHLLGHAEGRFVAVELFEDAIDQPAGAQLLDLVDHEALAADDPALAHVEDLHGRFQVIIGQADHIDVFAALGHHLLLLDGPVHRCQAIAHPRRPLVLHRVRRRAHLGVESLDDVVGVAFEEVAELCHELAVVDLIDLADAWTTALLDVEQQTRPAEPLMLVELAGAAGADREAAQQQIERVADRVGVCVRSEVLGSLALAATHDQRPGKLLVEGHRQERVALVIAQPDVEPRPVLFDEAVFQHQGFDLVADLDPLDALRRRHHLRRPRMHVPRILEVVRQPLTKARRLADVDHPPERVLELIRAWRIRNRSGRRTLHHRCRG